MRCLLALSLIALACPLPAQRPERPRPERRGDRPPARPQGYSLEQACSDRAQLHTIAFSGLAFLTGDVGSATFIPPGKVSDFFGFQYLRDIDATGKGHNPMFLDRICGAVLTLLDASQRQRFAQAAQEEAPMMEALARARLPLVAAFHRERDNARPVLDRAAVEACTADLFARDAALALHRARVFGAVARSLTPAQRSALGRLQFGDFRTWPEMDRESLRDLRPRGASRLESVAFMTLASEWFSWVAGSEDADTYFCPERHGTYFGGFYLKDLPAMGKRDYDISTALTGDAGEAFLEALDPSQRTLMDALLEAQRPALAAIVEVRRAISRQLRRALEATGPNEATVLALGRRYGQLDGELAWRYATTFAALRRSMTEPQKRRLVALRSQPGEAPGQAFLFSDRIPMRSLPPTDFLMIRK